MTAKEVLKVLNLEQQVILCMIEKHMFMLERPLYAFLFLLPVA